MENSRKHSIENSVERILSSFRTQYSSKHGGDVILLNNYGYDFDGKEYIAQNHEELMKVLWITDNGVVRTVKYKKEKFLATKHFILNEEKEFIIGSIEGQFTINGKFLKRWIVKIFIKRFGKDHSRFNVSFDKKYLNDIVKSKKVITLSKDEQARLDYLNGIK